VDGFLKAAEADQAIGATINLGSGREISIGDLAHLIGRVMGRELHIESDPERLRPENSEVQRLLASNELAKRLIQWEPRVSLEEGLSQTIAWMEENLGHFRPATFTV
jgi:dTDP-glucose 4,6-dehydratase